MGMNPLIGCLEDVRLHGQSQKLDDYGLHRRSPGGLKWILIGVACMHEADADDLCCCAQSQ